MIKMLGNRVLLKKIVKEQQQGGLILPDSAKDQQELYEVIEPGKVFTLMVGDIVVVAKYTAIALHHEGTDYIIAKEDDILCIINPKWHEFRNEDGTWIPLEAHNG